MSANVVVPEVGESIVDARVAKWLKKEGDAVSAGEPLVELETDKIDLEVSSPQAGVLGRIAHGDGADVKVGELLAVIEEDGGRRTEDGGRRTEDGNRPPWVAAREGAPLASCALVRRSGTSREGGAAKADGSRKPKCPARRLPRATPRSRTTSI